MRNREKMIAEIMGRKEVKLTEAELGTMALAIRLMRPAKAVMDEAASLIDAVCHGVASRDPAERAARECAETKPIGTDLEAILKGANGAVDGEDGEAEAC